MKFAKMILCCCCLAGVTFVMTGCGAAENTTEKIGTGQKPPAAPMTEGENTATAPE